MKGMGCRCRHLLRVDPDRLERDFEAHLVPTPVQLRLRKLSGLCVNTLGWGNG